MRCVLVVTRECATLTGEADVGAAASTCAQRASTRVIQYLVLGVGSVPNRAFTR
jgi:hypothetical protein